MAGNLLQRGGLAALAALGNLLGLQQRFWARELLGPSQVSTAGINVTEASALTFSAVFACVRVLAESMAQLPLHVYQRQPDGGKRRATEHHLYPLLHEQPTPEQTSYEWRETLQGHLGLRGNGYALIQQTRGGQTQSLPIFKADRMQPKLTKSGQLFYEYTPDVGSPIKYPPDRILHLHGLSSDGIKGYSPITVAREIIGLGLAAQEHGARMFANGATLGGILEFPTALNEAQLKNLRESWGNVQAGLKNVGKPGILEGGGKWHEVGMTNEDAQYLDTRRFQVAEVARLYRLPPHKIGDLTRSTNNNIEQQALEFVQDSLLPWVVRWEQRLCLMLLTPAERAAGYYIAFAVQGLLRGDIKTRAQFYQSGRQNGWFSANDIRKLEDLDPIEKSEGGDAYLVNGNMVPMGQAGQKPAEAPSANDLARSFEEATKRAIEDTRPIITQAPYVTTSTSTGGDVEFTLTDPDEDKAERRSLRARWRMADSFAEVLTESAGRIVRREVKEVRRLVKKHWPEGGNAGRAAPLRNAYGEVRLSEVESRALAGFRRDLSALYGGFAPIVADALRGPIKAYMRGILGEVSEELGEQITLTGEIGKEGEGFVDTLGKRHAVSSQRQIEAIVDETTEAGGEVAAAVDRRLDEWEEKRPGKIGDNEATRAGSYIAAAAYASVGITFLVWRARAAECPLCQKMDGRKVGVSKDFLSEGDTVEGGESTLTAKRSIRHPPLHGGCRCSVSPG